VTLARFAVAAALLLAVGIGVEATSIPSAEHDPAAPVPHPSTWGSSLETVARPAARAVPGLPWFQNLVDAASPGSVLKVPPGNYSGPVVVSKPLVIEGSGTASIDGGGKGTVMVLQTSGATLRGLTLKGSGNSHDSDDACLNLRGNRNIVENNVITDCLFGIDLKQADKNLVRGNRITSKPVDLGLRGDGIRIWYSMDNRIEENTIVDSRDTVVWYSKGNVITRNVTTGSRYSLHFMFSHENVVEGNRYVDNAVGVYVMYTDGVVIRNNVISHATGATGLGIGFKEASNGLVEGNDVVYCSVGISSDLSPYEPDTKIRIRGNRLAYNGIGLNFVSDKTDNIMESNTFEGNLVQVAVGGAGSAQRNEWRDNYWDDYQGFDRDRDGKGDTAYELYAYADQIWMEIPQAMFFKTAPAMEVLDFLERLAPFSSPNLILKDETPRFESARGQGHGRS
jgi:nitrous oxidase accessory protein